MVKTVELVAVTEDTDLETPASFTIHPAVGCVPQAVFAVRTIAVIAEPEVILKVIVCVVAVAAFTLVSVSVKLLSVAPACATPSQGARTKDKKSNDT